MDVVILILLFGCLALIALCIYLIFQTVGMSYEIKGMVKRLNGRIENSQVNDNLDDFKNDRNLFVNKVRPINRRPKK